MFDTNIVFNITLVHGLCLALNSFKEIITAVYRLLADKTQTRILDIQ